MWSDGLPRPVLYTIEDICSMFSWDRSTYYRHVREGRFPRPRRIGMKWHYTREDLDAYLLLAGRWEPGPFDEAERKKTTEEDET